MAPDPSVARTRYPTPNTVKITLTDADLGVVQILGALRASVSRAAGSVPRQFGHDQITNDTIGVAAEYAWGKHHNTFPDLTFHARRHGCDAVKDGWRVDIKSTTLAQGRLILNPAQTNPDIDLYVLALVALPTVHFVGFATAKELRAERHLTNLGHGPVYAMEQRDLRPFKEDLREGADRSKPATVAGNGGV